VACRASLRYFLKKKLYYKKILKPHRVINVPPKLMGCAMLVNGGHTLKKIVVTSFHIHKKAGEFSFTRKPYFYPLRKKKK
jgi:ribosomal protein S19